MTLFEPRQGVLRVRAVSALEGSSKLSPFLVVPARGLFTLARGRSPIPILAGVELQETYPHWRTGELRLRVLGVVLASLEGLDAPAETTRRFFPLAGAFLRRCPDGSELAALALYLLHTLRLLGLLGGETSCTLCGRPLTARRVPASADLQTFICKECFNRLYSRAEVSVAFVERKHLELASRLAIASPEEAEACALGSDELMFIFSLAAARLAELLPSAVAALLPLTAFAVPAADSGC